MTETAPFRERPRFLLCPRCGEMLDHAFDAVLSCLRCEGVWIAPLTAEKAFGDPKWPHANAMWWRNSLECPECSHVGVTTVMTAAMADGVVVDRCQSHGLWLDRGELGRLMGGATADVHGDDDLAALREKLSIGEVDLEQLLKRREAWRSDVLQRRQAATEYRLWLEAEQRRRIEAAENLVKAEREQEAAERRRAAEHSERERTLAEAAHAAARALLEARRERERNLQRLGDARQSASAEVARLETQIIMVRQQLRSTEAELEGARVRLRAVDDQLEALQP